MTLNFPNTPLGFDALRKSLPSDTIENLIIGKYWILIETHCGIGLVATPPLPKSAEFGRGAEHVEDTSRILGRGIDGDARDDALFGAGHDDMAAGGGAP